VSASVAGWTEASGGLPGLLQAIGLAT
jgi:hypothetical protein